MARNKSEGSGTVVTNIADARKDRLNKSTIAYGRRHGDDGFGPNSAAQNNSGAQQLHGPNLGAKPNVRQVRDGRATGRRFDKEKVDRIKAQLANGEYQINPLKVADLFIEHERHS